MKKKLSITAVVLFCLLGLGSCNSGKVTGPNIVWIVWDTVRADRLSIYRPERKTTPFLQKWAKDGRVFDCSSVSCWTVPSHASMFTGLFPGEHGVQDVVSELSEEHDTVAELLRDQGYQTYLFSANPFVSRSTKFSQGFQIEEHPYDKKLAAEAQDEVVGKIDPQDQSSDMSVVLGKGSKNWSVKAVGELINRRFFRFLSTRDQGRPFFAFLNYMEAHRVRIPSRESRGRLMTREEVTASYTFNQTQARFQRISLGLEEPFSEKEQKIVEAVYDATLLELDMLLDEIFRKLQATPELLSNTVVILTSDHGEHLGDHGSYLHQYSLYEGVLNVPLVIWAPGRLSPGTEIEPVMNIDLFPTVLELASIPVPERPGTQSLLGVKEDRLLVAEYPKPYEPVLSKFIRSHPEWDSSPYRQGLRTARSGAYKLLWRSSGEQELYNLADDPGEEINLKDDNPEMTRLLAKKLEGWLELRSLVKQGGERELSPDERERLKALGYLGDDDAQN